MKLEIKRRPAAPLAGFEQDSLTLDLDNCRVRVAVAMDQQLDRDRCRLFEKSVIRPDDPGSGRLVYERQPRPFPAAFVKRLGRGVLGEVLVGAIGPEHVGRTHSADAAVMAVMRRAGRVVGWKVVKRRGDSRGVQVVPERSALAPEHRRGRFVVERPEVELEPVVTYLSESFARYSLGGRVERNALFFRMSMNEVKDPVRAGPRSVDEVSPGNGTLGRRAGTQPAETTARPAVFPGSGADPLSSCFPTDPDPSRPRR